MRIGSLGSGKDTFCPVHYKTFDIKKDKMIYTLTYKNAKGEDVKQKIPVTCACWTFEHRGYVTVPKDTKAGTYKVQFTVESQIEDLNIKSPEFDIEIR